MNEELLKLTEQLLRFQELYQATEDPVEGRMGVVSALKELTGWRGRHPTAATKRRSQLLSLGIREGFPRTGTGGGWKNKQQFLS